MSAGVQAATFPLSTFDRLQGLIVYDIIEDADGNIWLGADSGVWRWRDNGFESVIATAGNNAGAALPRGWGHGATTLACSTDNTLWVGTGTGLLALDMKKLEPRPVPEPLRRLQINHVRQIDGDVWFCTTAGLFKFGSFDDSRATISQALYRHENIQDVAKQGDAFWIATNGEVRESRGGETTIHLQKEIVDRTVTLLAASDGSVWIGARKAPGLYRYHNGGMTKFEARQGLASSEINCLTEAARGEIWVGTEHGAFRWSGGQFTAIDRNSGLHHDDVHAILIDHEAETWIGTFGGGAYLLRSPEVVIYSTVDGLAEPFVSDICELAGDSLLVGSLRGLSEFDAVAGRGKAVDVRRLSKSICRGGDNRHWIAGSDSIECHETGESIKIRALINQLAQGPDGSILISSNAGLLQQRIGKEKPETIPTPREIGRIIHCSMMSRDGKLFVGGDRGVAVELGGADAGSWEIVPTDSPVRIIAESPEGEVWIGTMADLSRIQTGSSASRGQTYDTGGIYAIAFDSFGRLWAGGEQGLFRIAENGLQRLTLADGLPSPDVRALHFTNPSTLWAGTTSGLARIDPQQIAFSDRAPRINIEIWNAAVAQPRTVRGIQSVDLADQSLIAMVTPIGRRNTQGMHYRFRIDGHDPNWSAWKADPRYRLQPLPPGKYSILAQGKSANGAVSGEVLRRFEVLAPFWRTPPFLIALSAFCFAGMAGTAFLVQKRTLYLRRIEQSQRRFRSLVESIRAIPYERAIEAGEFTYVGPQSKSIVGFSAEEWRKSDFLSKQVPEVDLARLRTAWRNALHGDREITMEHRIHDADGATRWLKNIVSPPEYSRRSGVLRGLMVDVTAEHRMMATERMLREELEQAVSIRTTALTLSNEALRMEIDTRKRAEEALRSSEHQFAQIFNASPIAMILTRASDSELLRANDAFLRLTGLRRDDVIGRRDIEINTWVSGDDRRQFHDSLRWAGRVRDMIVESSAESGMRRISRISAETIDVAGEPCILGIAEDVTEQISAERSLERQRSFLKQLVDVNPNIIFTKDASLRYTMVNKALADFYGTAPEQIIGRRDADFSATPEEIERLTRIDREVIESGREILSPDEMVTDAQGNIHYFQTMKLPLVTEAEVGLLGVATDVTARKSIENKLRRTQDELRAANEKLEERVRDRTRELEETQAFLRQVLETSPSFIFVKDADGRFLFVNRAMQEAYGVPPDEIVGRRESEIRPDVRFEATRADADPASMDAECPVTSLERFLSREGAELWFNVVRSPLVRPDGSRHIMGIATNITEQVRIEEELRNSLDRLELIARGANDGFWDAILHPGISWRSPDTSIYYSERFKSLLGFEDAEFPNRLSSWSERLHPEDRERVFEALAAHFERKVPYEVEYRLKLKSGEYRWFQARGQARWNPDGEPVRMAGSLNDITRRKTAEQQLRRQALVFDNIYDGVLITDLNGAITDWNHGSERIFGYDRLEILGRSPEVLNRPAEAAKNTEIIQSAMSTHGAWSGEIRFVDKAGREGTCDVKVVNLLDDSGRRVGVASFNRDITEQKRAEEQMRLFADIVNNMQTGLYVWQSKESDGGRPFRLVLMNPSARIFSGCVGEELVGTVHDANFKGLLKLETPDVCEEVIRSQRIHDLGILRTEPSDGQPGRILAAKAFPLPNQCVGIELEDITAQKSAEEALEKSMERERQTQKIKAVGMLASGIAHEFSDLLTMISTYADLAKSTLPMNHPAAMTLEKVEDTARHARGATNALMTFSRRSTVNKTTINLSEVLFETLHLLGRVIPGRIEIVPRIDLQTPVWIHADASQIDQVLLNLTVNAKDATPGDGRITVSLFCETQDAKGTAGDVIASNQTAIITISDTGQGMPPDVLDKIFVPFFTTKQRGQGTGLGLSITAGIVENLGGRITAESQAGKGTTFRIEIPCCPPKAEAAPPARLRTRVTDDLIVVVERNPQVRSIMTSTLRTTGCDVKPATRIDDAIAFADRKMAGARLLIVDLDGVSSEEMERLNHFHQHHAEMQVIVIVGTVAMDLTRLPPDSLLIRKPFEMPELSHLVEECLLRRLEEKGPTHAK